MKQAQTQTIADYIVEIGTKIGQYQAQLDKISLELDNEVRSNRTIQWSLLKYVINHPEKAHIISNKEVFEGDPRSILNKLSEYLNLLSAHTDTFSILGLIAPFDPVDKMRMEEEIKNAIEPDGEYNAIQYYKRLENTYNKKRILDGSFDILSSYSDSIDIVSLKARNLANISKIDSSDTVDFKLGEQMPKSKFTLMKDGIPIFQEDNFYIVMGYEKSGKSHFLAILLAAYISGTLPSFGLESMLEETPNILYLDIDQNVSNAENIVETANLILGKKYHEINEFVNVSSLSTVDTELMMDKFIEKLEIYNPKIVFIDGYAGFIDDVYKSAGIDPIMKKFRSIARKKNLVIIGTFHAKRDSAINPDIEEEDLESPFGAAGKQFQRYAAGTFHVINKEGNRKIINKVSRYQQCPDFYCKFEDRLYIDIPGEDTPACYNMNGKTIAETLVSIGRNIRDINSKDVHSYAVPYSISEDAYKEQIRTIKAKKLADKDEDKEAIKEQSEEIRQQRSNERKMNEAEEYCSIVFKDSTEIISRKIMDDRYCKYMEEHLTSKDKEKDPYQRRNTFQHQSTRKRDKAYNLKLIAPYDEGLNTFKYNGDKIK